MTKKPTKANSFLNKMLKGFVIFIAVIYALDVVFTLVDGPTESDFVDMAKLFAIEHIEPPETATFPSGDLLRLPKVSTGNDDTFNLLWYMDVNDGQGNVESRPFIIQLKFVGTWPSNRSSWQEELFLWP